MIDTKYFNDGKMEMCLCSVCRQHYEDLPDHDIKRLNPKQCIKDTCDLCQVRLGFDYIITHKPMNPRGKIHEN